MQEVGFGQVFRPFQEIQIALEGGLTLDIPAADINTRDCTVLEININAIGPTHT